MACWVRVELIWGNQSRQIGNGYAVTVYLLHNCPSEQTLSQLRELPVVKRVIM